MNSDFPDCFNTPVCLAVAGKRVLDLGAGDLKRAHKLMALGAARVFAIDKAPMPAAGDLHLVTLQAAFESELALWAATGFKADVAHVAWPINHANDLRWFVCLAPCVIYIGNNTGGNACGTPELFNQFRYRPVMAYVPTRRNTLIIYGQSGMMPRQALHHEEIAGLENTRADGFDAYNDDVATRVWTPRT